MKVEKSFKWGVEEEKVINAFFELMTTEVCEALSLDHHEGGCDNYPFCEFCGENASRILGIGLAKFSGMKFNGSEG